MTNKILKSDQVADFRRDGFLLARSLFSPEEMTDLAAWTDEVEAWPETAGRHMMYFETSLKSDGARIRAPHRWRHKATGQLGRISNKSCVLPILQQHLHTW